MTTFLLILIIVIPVVGIYLSMKRLDQVHLKLVAVSVVIAIDFGLLLLAESDGLAIPWNEVFTILMLSSLLTSIYFAFKATEIKERLIAVGLGIASLAILFGIASLLEVQNIQGLFSFLITFGVTAGVYALLSLGLNIHWGYTGLFNIGVAAFFGVGAYTSAILVKIPTISDANTAIPLLDHATYFGMPYLIGLVGAMLASGILALLIGLVTLRLREDYLAIATIGIAETIRLIATNEEWLTEGSVGINRIAQPLREFLVGTMQLPTNYYIWAYLVFVLLALGIFYFLLKKLVNAPWGRVLKAIREDEDAASSLGKNTFSFKLQSLVVGAMVMGAAGSLFIHSTGSVGPTIINPLEWTFIVWVMLIVGGTGNNKGAIFGAIFIWGVWVGTGFMGEFLPSFIETPIGDIRVGARIFGPLRIIAIAAIFIFVLLNRSKGLLGEKKATFTTKESDQSVEPNQ
jgi:branched-chain amino acid transport system permease protein